jgi:hypothetical protein
MSLFPTSLRIRRRSDLTTMQNAATATGAGTAITLDGGSGVLVAQVQATSSPTYTVVFKGNADSAAAYDANTTVTLDVRRRGNGATTAAASVTQNGTYEVDVSGMGIVWAQITAYSGTGGQSLTVKAREADMGRSLTGLGALYHLLQNFVASGTIDTSYGVRTGALGRSRLPNTVSVSDPTAPRRVDPFYDGFGVQHNWVRGASGNADVQYNNLTSATVYYDPGASRSSTYEAGGGTVGGVIVKDMAGGLVGGSGFLVTTFTASASDDTLTAAAHGYSTATVLQVSSTGTLPAGLSAATNLYVVNPTLNTFQLSLSEGGAAINITDAGSGTHTATPNSLPTAYGVQGRLIIPMRWNPVSYGDVRVDLFFDSSIADTITGTTISHRYNAVMSLQVYIATTDTDAGNFTLVHDTIYFPTEVQLAGDLRVSFSADAAGSYGVTGEPGTEDAPGVVDRAHFQIPEMRGATPALMFKFALPGAVPTQGKITRLYVTRAA